MMTEVLILSGLTRIILLFAEKEMCVRIHSNGIKYSEAIARCLAKNLVSVVIFLDYATIKPKRSD